MGTSSVKKSFYHSLPRKNNRFSYGNLRILYKTNLISRSFSSLFKNLFKLSLTRWRGRSTVQVVCRA